MCIYQPQKTTISKGWKVLVHLYGRLCTVYQLTPVKPNTTLTAIKKLRTNELENKTEFGLSAFRHKKDAIEFIRFRNSRKGYPDKRYFIAPITTPQGTPKLRGRFTFHNTLASITGVDVVVSDVQEIGTPTQITGKPMKLRNS